MKTFTATAVILEISEKLSEVSVLLSIMNAQDRARQMINQRRQSALELLDFGGGLRSASAYIERQIEQSRRMRSLRYPSLAKLFCAVVIDQLILITLFAFLLGLPLWIAYSSIFAWTDAIFIGPFSLRTFATANSVFSAAECIALQFFLYAARFESSIWLSTPGRMLFGMKSCDSEGDPLSFASSRTHLLGQHLIVGIATLTIILPLSYKMREVFTDAYLRVLVPMLPLFAYFALSFLRVDRRTIFQMVSRQTTKNEEPIPLDSFWSIFSQGLHILFTEGDSRNSGKARLDFFLTILLVCSSVWLIVCINTIATNSINLPGSFGHLF